MSNAPRNDKDRPTGVRDIVFAGYNAAHDHARLVFVDGTTTQARVVHVNKFDVKMEEHGIVLKTDVVGSFIRSWEDLKVDTCEVTPIAPKTADRPAHAALKKLVKKHEDVIGAKVRLELACGWVIEGLVTTVRPFVLTLQKAGNHKVRAHILRHAITAIEVLEEPGANDDSDKVIAHWRKIQADIAARKARREAQQAAVDNKA